MILVVDNYDSFTHNLARYLRLAGAATHVLRNDEVDVAGVRALAPAALVLSPGPGAPRDAGCTLELVRALHAELPILGVCLGMQAIAEGLGGRVARAPEPLHGRASAVRHDGTALFSGVPSPFAACRYHSLAVDAAALPQDLRVTAVSDDGVVMALAHRRLPVMGVQFHPEAELTEHGLVLMRNFVRIANSPLLDDS